jgi:hypothetical protein
MALLAAELTATLRNDDVPGIREEWMPGQAVLRTLVKKVQRVVAVVDENDAFLVGSDGETE